MRLNTFVLHKPDKYLYLKYLSYNIRSDKFKM